MQVVFVSVCVCVWVRVCLCRIKIGHMKALFMAPGSIIVNPRLFLFLNDIPDVSQL